MMLSDGRQMDALIKIYTDKINELKKQGSQDGDIKQFEDAIDILERARMQRYEILMAMPETSTVRRPLINWHGAKS